MYLLRRRLRDRYFHHQRNIFNTTEILRSLLVDKQLKRKIVHTIEAKDGLRSESQIFVNSRVVLVNRNNSLTFMELPQLYKRYRVTEVPE
jgi:hypothetical protein